MTIKSSASLSGLFCGFHKDRPNKGFTARLTYFIEKMTYKKRGYPEFTSRQPLFPIIKSNPQPFISSLPLRTLVST